MVQKNKIMDIVCNINEAYVQHCAVMLCSLFMNNKDIHFRVHILYFSISQQVQAELSEFVESLNCEIFFYEVNKLEFELPNLQNHYISAETYLRLFISNYIPRHIEKVLYLDVDMVVLGKINELVNTDLENCLLGAIEDSPNAERQKRLGLPEKYGYFNAGVLLLNLKYWREHQIMEKSISFIKKSSEKIRQHDQDILNVVADGHWKRISFKWNMLNTFFFRHPVVEDKYLKEVEDCKQDVRIAHFSGGVKPWMAWEKHPYYKEYYKYLEYTPWRGYRPSLKQQWKAYKFPRNILRIIGIDKIIVKVLEK